ncbi:MAG: MATE family efflux transporter [Clostridia bacterium]|nr:MATE family efflux transporter [Clostridia bacterium]
MKPSQTRGKDFTQGRVWENILSQAIPLTLAQLVQLLYNVVDRIYIGHMGDGSGLALTGVGLAFPFVTLILAFTSLFGMGGTPLFSIARGQKDDERAERILGSVFFLLTASSIALMALCYALKRPLLYLFGASDASFGYASAYLTVYLLGTPFSMITNGLNGFINAQGFPRMGMLTTIIGALLNLILDPIFIFWLDMGVAGAALATVISQIVSAVWVLAFLTGKKAALRIRRKHLCMERALTGQIVSLGASGFVMQGTNFLVQISANTMLQGYGGDLYVGVMTVLSSVREVFSMPISGLSNGCQPVLGYNFGAGRKDRVKEGIRFTIGAGLVYTGIGWLLVMLFPKALFGIFSSDEAMLAIGPRALNMYFFGFVCMAFQFAGQSTFLALGRAKMAICFALLRKVVIVVPLTLLLPGLGLGVDGVFLAEPASNIIGGLICFAVMMKTVYRKL